MNDIETHFCKNCKRKFLTRDPEMEFCNLGCEQEYEEGIDRNSLRLIALKWLRKRRQTFD